MTEWAGDGAPAAARRRVVIGIGNEFRRDDGVGPEVLARLREQADTGQLDTGQLDTVQLDIGQLDTVQLDSGQLDTVQLDSGQLDSGQLDTVQLGTVQLVSSDGEPTSLIEAWTGAALAVVVDAVLADPAVPGRLHRLVLDRMTIDVRPVSSHGLGLGEAIGLARALDRMPDRLIVHAVEAADVGHGVGFTPAVAAAVAPLTAAVLRDLSGPVGV